MLNCSSTFQILLDLFSVLAVISFRFFVEFLVAFIDIINISIVKMLTPSMKLLSFLNSTKEKIRYLENVVRAIINRNGPQVML